MTTLERRRLKVKEINDNVNKTLEDRARKDVDIFELPTGMTEKDTLAKRQRMRIREILDGKKKE